MRLEVRTQAKKNVDRKKVGQYPARLKKDVKSVKTLARTNTPSTRGSLGVKNG